MTDLVTQEVVDNKIVELVAFNLNDENYAIEIKYIQEIIRMQEITDVPHSETYLLGVINLRGQVIPVIDLKKKFNLGCYADSGSTRIIVVETDEFVVGMVVDSVSEVLRLDRGQIEPPSPVIASIETDYIRGVGKVDGKMVIILVLEKVLGKSSSTADKIVHEASNSNMLLEG